MKNIVLNIFLIIPLLTFSQSQIGGDIDGEATGDWSGRSVSMSSDGSIVAIGADKNNGNTGSVRVYEYISPNWIQIGADIDGEATGDYSGMSVSMSSDGSIVAIGAPQNNLPNGPNIGYVRVYEYISPNWVQIGLDINGEALWDTSGYSVSLSSDGSIVAIGAPENNNVNGYSGSVRVYKNNLGTWTKIGADIDGEVELDSFGVSVSLSSDGNILAIGAYQGRVGVGSDFGYVRIFQNISGTWTQIGTDIDGEALYDYLGYSVSLSSDGSIVAIGVPYNDGNLTSDSGSVQVYKNNLGTWTQIGLDIDGEAADDWSGLSVSLSSDGNILAIGAPNNNGNGSGSGSVRIYQNSSGTWTQIGLDIDGKAINNFLGVSVFLASNGGKVAIGAPNGANPGYVQMFDLSTVVLSLEDNFISRSFSMYPNPATKHLQLTLNSELELQGVIVYNLLGQPLLKSKETSLDISNLSTGVYYVEILTDQGKGIKKVIIK